MLVEEGVVIVKGGVEVIPLGCPKLDFLIIVRLKRLHESIISGVNLALDLLDVILRLVDPLFSMIYLLFGLLDVIFGLIDLGCGRKDRWN